MKEKDLKRMLEDELESIAPRMSDKVADAPIGVPSEKSDGKRVARRAGTRRPAMRVVTISAIAAVLVIAIVLAVVIPPVLAPSGGAEPGYVLMNINPEVGFVFDEEGKVTAVKAGNPDADALLSDAAFRRSLIGKDVSTAAAEVADKALALGYIEGDVTSPDAVKLTVVGGDDSAAEEIGEAVRSAFVGSGAACLVVTETADKQLLAVKYGVEDGALEDMLAEIQSTADMFFERTSQTLSSVTELVQAYADYVAKYLKNSVRTLGAEANAVYTLLNRLDAVNDEIAALATDMVRDPFGLFGPSDCWDVYDYLEEHPDYEMSAELTQKMDEAESILASLQTFGCTPSNGTEASVLTTAIGWVVDIYDQYGDDICAEIDNAQSAVSEIVAEVNRWYAFAENTVADIIGEASDKLPTVLTEFGNVLGIVADFAGEAITSVQDFAEQTITVIDAAYEELEQLGTALDISREKISASEYSDLESAIEEQYGSLSAWYQTLQ